MERKLDLTATWNDAMTMLRAHSELVLTVAGVFLFLPPLLFGWLVPPLTPDSSLGPEQNFAAMFDWYGANWAWLLLIAALASIGAVAILALLLTRNGLSVGEAIARGGRLFIPYVLVSIIAAILGGIGMIFLIIPGIWILMRLSVAQTIVAAEQDANPIRAIQRSWRLTRGHALRIFLFLLVVLIVALVAYIAIDAVSALIFGFLLPQGARLFLMLVVNSLLTALLTILFLACYAAIYRQLAAPGAEGAAEDPQQFWPPSA